MQRPSIRTSLVAGTVALAAVTAIYFQRDAWLNTAEAAEPAAAAAKPKKPLPKPKSAAKDKLKPATKLAKKPAAAAPPSDPFNNARRAPAEERYPEAAATDDTDIPAASFAGDVNEVGDKAPPAMASDEPTDSGDTRTGGGSVNFGGVEPRIIVTEEEELLGASAPADRNPRARPDRDRYPPAAIDDAVTADDQPLPAEPTRFQPPTAIANRRRTSRCRALLPRMSQALIQRPTAFPRDRFVANRAACPPPRLSWKWTTAVEFLVLVVRADQSWKVRSRRH